MNKKILLFCLGTLSAFAFADDNGHELGDGFRRASLPLNLVIGVAPYLGPYGDVSSEEASNIIEEWNTNTTLTQHFGGRIIQLERDCTSSDYQDPFYASFCGPQAIRNQIDEVHLSNIDFIDTRYPNALGVAFSRVIRSQKLIKETDIFLAYNKILATPSQVPNCSATPAHIFNSVLLHEVGHAFGLTHVESPDILMSAQMDRCDLNPVGEGDFNQILRKYGNFSSAVNITSPNPNLQYFVGQNVHFNSFTSSLSRGKNTKEAAQTKNSTIDWSSNLDGLIGRGQSLNTRDLSAGIHSVKAKSSNNNTLEDYVAFEVKSSIQSNFGDLADPIPCIRLAGSSEPICYLYITETPRIGGICAPALTYDVTARNESTNHHFRVFEPDYGFDGVGVGIQCRPFLDYTLRSIVEVKTNAQFIPFQFVRTAKRGNSIKWVNNIRGVLPVVDTNIDFNLSSLQCRREGFRGVCDLKAQWSEHYFAPYSGLYKRYRGTGEFIFVKALGTPTGSLTLNNIDVGADGAEFTVFQYSQALNVFPRHPLLGPTIRAPKGQMTSPHLITAPPIPITPDQYDNNSDADGNGKPHDDIAPNATAYLGVAQRHNFHTTNDRDWFLYHSLPNHVILETSNVEEHADTCMRLYKSNATATDVSGSAIASNCDFDGGRGSRITYNQTTEGIYFVEIWNQNNSGARSTHYTFSISSNPLPIEPDAFEQNDTAQQASHYLGTPQHHNFHDINDRDWVIYYSLPNAIRISTSNLGVYADTCIRLYKSNENFTGVDGSPIRANCDANGTQNSEILFDQIDEGAYYIETWNQNGKHGIGTDYTLTLKAINTHIPPDAYENDNTASQAAGYQVNTPQNRNFHSAGDRDWVVYFSPAGRMKLYTDDLGWNADTCMRLYRSNDTATGTSGDAITSNCDANGIQSSEIIFDQPDDYVYYIEIWHQYGRQGLGTEYTFKAESLAPLN